MQTHSGARVETNKSMKYILMMNTMKENSNAILSWPKETVQAHIAYMMSLNKELSAAGELVSAEGLAWPDQAKMVRSDEDGAPNTDGVFPESKEFLAGFWFVDVETAERAYAMAAKASAAPASWWRAVEHAGQSTPDHVRAA